MQKKILKMLILYSYIFNDIDGSDNVESLFINISKKDKKRILFLNDYFKIKIVKF